MNFAELAVIVLGAVLGYWIVSQLFKAKPPAPPDPFRQAAAEQPPATFSSPSARRWHEVLGVLPEAPPEQIRSAYKVLMSQYHPDKVAALGIELRQLAERKSQEIGAAYRDGMRSHGLEP